MWEVSEVSARPSRLLLSTRWRKAFVPPVPALHDQVGVGSLVGVVAAAKLGGSGGVVSTTIASQSLADQLP